MSKARQNASFTLYPYLRALDQDWPPARHRVVIVGAGPVGLCLALDLGLKGIPVLLLDDGDGPGIGSRAICFSKRTLDIAHRLGAAAPMVDKGVVWNVGRVFHGEGELFNFDLQPQSGHRHPAFINLQQPHFERFLFERVEAARAGGAPINIRGGNRVTAIDRHHDHTVLTLDTPDGPYTLKADWLIACDGARSPIRGMCDLDFEGRVFEDNFLIADVRMTADFPTERWFWFEPPFANARSALLHKQPDDIWRIDFQLGPDIDRKAELDPARIRARVDAMLSSQTGTVPEYDLDWTSIYTFQCRQMRDFRHGRLLFAGDAAHQVSPFGARGANSGLQDAENLAWKLALVLDGLAPEGLIDSYHDERAHAARENILHSSRATDFMTPRSHASGVFRDAVLTLAKRHSFARPMVNSGRLSVPCSYDGFALFSPDDLPGPAESRPGMACPDAPVGASYLLDMLTGGFTLLLIGAAELQVAEVDGIPIQTLNISDPSPDLAARYLGSVPRAVYLIRPDQHIAARWADPDPDLVIAALRTAIGKGNGCH